MGAFILPVYSPVFRNTETIPVVAPVNHSSARMRHGLCEPSAPRSRFQQRSAERIYDIVTSRSRHMTVLTAPLPRTVVVPSSGGPVTGVARARWLDAMRGFTMFCLISRGFGFPRL